MSATRRLLIAFAIAAALALVLRWLTVSEEPGVLPPPAPTAAATDSASAMADAAASDAGTGAQPPGTPAPVLAPRQGRLPLPAPNASALQSMVNLLAEFSRPDRSLDDLLAFLQGTKQDPLMAEDRNPYSGDMTMVRTKSPLQNTRYFHAQFFTDDQGRKFAQHISFEYKPGPHAMDNAIKAVQRAFPSLGEPSYENGEFRQWDVGNGYVVWVKRLGATDLEDNPFQTYGKEDLGTIRVALEQNPHDGE